MTRLLILASAILMTTAGVVEAHTGHGATGLVHGFAHPFTGLDHLAAMVAVGLFGARLGGRALWLVPGSFLVMMSAGGAAGIAGYSIPYAETAVVASVAVLGAAALLRWRAPVALAMGLAGFFAIFHGLVHGAEMPAAASGLVYAVGFVTATAILHGAGAGLGLVLNRISLRRNAAGNAA